MLAIGCGYPDGNDFDRLRFDPAFKLACGRLPDSGGDLCSQPTISRWENAPTLREIIRLTYALVDIWCRSYPKPPRSVVLDIDDTVDVVHGHQQLAQWNAHYDERCFLPIHVYDAATGAPVTVILRPGKTPSGVEVRKLLSRLIGRIRRHWPSTRITIRGDGHYGREEAMTWCENYGIDYIFGLSGNVVLDRLVDAAADDIRVRRAVNQAEVLRGFAETRYAAKSWDKERRVVARIEASASHADDMLRRGIDIRYVVTSLQGSDAGHIYETIYCARGQAENLIKQHKAQLSIRSHQLPLAPGQPDAAHLAHWCLLAAPRPACCNPELEAAAAHRVRDDLSASLEDRQPYHRACEPHSYRARLMLPRGRHIQSCRAQAATVWTISQRGDDAPPSPDPFTPNASTAFIDRTNLPKLRRAETAERASQKLAFSSCVRVHKMSRQRER